MGEPRSPPSCLPDPRHFDKHSSSSWQPGRARSCFELLDSAKRLRWVCPCSTPITDTAITARVSETQVERNGTVLRRPHQCLVHAVTRDTGPVTRRAVRGTWHQYVTHPQWDTAKGPCPSWSSHPGKWPAGYGSRRGRWLHDRSKVGECFAADSTAVSSSLRPPTPTAFSCSGTSDSLCPRSHHGVTGAAPRQAQGAEADDSCGTHARGAIAVQSTGVPTVAPGVPTSSDKAGPDAGPARARARWWTLPSFPDPAPFSSSDHHRRDRQSERWSSWMTEASVRLPTEQP
nr:hypothetical protein CFP56_30131 [Quercus suber]